jgi:hypothetical protein
VDPARPNDSPRYFLKKIKKDLTHANKGSMILIHKETLRISKKCEGALVEKWTSLMVNFFRCHAAVPPVTAL